MQNKITKRCFAADIGQISEDNKNMHVNKEDWLKYIRYCFSMLMYQVELSDSVRLYDLNVVSEDIYKDILNKIFEWNLQNVNVISANAKSIDLKDDEKNIIVQVSSRRDKQKLQLALDGLDQAKYLGWTFYYLSITHDPPKRDTCKFNVPNGIKFISPDNVLGIESLFRRCAALEIERIKMVYDCCVSHFHEMTQRTIVGKCVSIDDARWFIVGYAPVYAELGILQGICAAYLEYGECWEYSINRIRTHIEAHLNRRLVDSVDAADEFMRRVAWNKVLWEQLYELGSHLVEIDRQYVGDRIDVEHVAANIESALNGINCAARIIYSQHPNPQSFEYEFNKAME